MDTAMLMEATLENYVTNSVVLIFMSTLYESRNAILSISEYDGKHLP